MTLVHFIYAAMALINHVNIIMIEDQMIIVLNGHVGHHQVFLNMIIILMSFFPFQGDGLVIHTW